MEIENLDGFSVLVVEDEEFWWRRIGPPLRARGFSVSWKRSRDEAIRAIRTGEFSVVMLDLDLSGRNRPDDGLAILETFAEQPVLDSLRRPANPIFIVITVFDKAEPALRAMRAGAAHFLVKSSDPTFGDLVTEKARQEYLGLLERRAAEKEEVVFKSSQMAMVMDTVRKYAESDESVLITGESGTGKEVVARVLHEIWRARRAARGPFLPVNIGGLVPELVESELFGHEKGAFTGASQRKVGLFELAESGTLFLDEIGEASLSVQIKLLRVLQDKKMRRLGGTSELAVDVRLVAATNQDLGVAIRKGSFRSDLFYRINMLPVEVPPLRERLDDIEPLIAHFIRYFNRGRMRRILGMSSEALEVLKAYRWPGNVRELRNVIARAMAFVEGEVIGEECLPNGLRDDFRARPSRLGGQPDLTRDVAANTEALERLLGMPIPSWSESVETLRGLLYHGGRRNARIPRSGEIAGRMVALMSRLNASGYSYDSIAAELGVSVVAVRNWRSRWEE